VSDQVSHPYKTTGKIRLLCFLIFTFVDSKLESKRFCTEWQQAYPDFNLLLISSWTEFWFIRSRIFEMSRFFRLLSVFMLWHRPTSWHRDMTMHLVLAAFISSPMWSRTFNRHIYFIPTNCTNLLFIYKQHIKTFVLFKLLKLLLHVSVTDWPSSGRYNISLNFSY